jgi:hypothetical protein
MRCASRATMQDPLLDQPVGGPSYALWASVARMSSKLTATELNVRTGQGSKHVRVQCRRYDHQGALEIHMQRISRACIEYFAFARYYAQYDPSYMFAAIGLA